MPDEFDLWFKNTVETIKTDYRTVEQEYYRIFKLISDQPLSKTRKGFATLAKQFKHAPILFKMYDGKDYSDYIWDQIKPVRQKPLWVKS